MKKDKWKAIIEQACTDAGTYKPYFDSVIDTLSQIMETRDITFKQWVDEGSEPVIIHTNKAGEPNPTKNPLLTMVNDLNTQALTHWKELGLTPSGLRKINESAINPSEKKESALEKLLREAIDEKNV